MDRSLDESKEVFKEELTWRLHGWSLTEGDDVQRSTPSWLFGPPPVKSYLLFLRHFFDDGGSCRPTLGGLCCSGRGGQLYKSHKGPESVELLQSQNCRVHIPWPGSEPESPEHLWSSDIDVALQREPLSVLNPLGFNRIGLSLCHHQDNQNKS